MGTKMRDRARYAFADPRCSPASVLTKPGSRPGQKALSELGRPPYLAPKLNHLFRLGWATPASEDPSGTLRHRWMRLSFSCGRIRLATLKH
jgi:hypothetical protein